MCWLLCAALYLIPVINGAITFDGWLNGMLLAPIVPILAMLYGEQGFGPYLLPLLAVVPPVLAALAIWRHGDPRWRRLACIGFALWWMLLSIVMSVGV